MKMNTDLKKCTMCNEMKDTNEYLKKCGRCKSCRKIFRKQYRIDNITKFVEKDKKYNETHKDQIKLRVSNYYINNRDKIQAQRKKYREDNPEEYKKTQREYYHKNLDRRLGLIYRTRVRREIKSGKNYLEYLGCDVSYLKKWFEFNFSIDEFEWEGHGDRWEIDHVTPCSTFNMNNKEEVYKCFNWQNTKPVNKSFNRKKSNKILYFQKIEQEIRLALFKRQNKSEKNLTTAV